MIPLPTSHTKLFAVPKSIAIRLPMMIKYTNMQAVTISRIGFLILGIVFVSIFSVAVILFARGYRPNFQSRQLKPTGILVATTFPDSAQIYINNILKSVTPLTTNLAPGNITIDIKKDGYFPWTKKMLIQPETVTRISAYMFPSVPSLKAVTTSGASLPTLSPDGTKIAYISGTNLYTLDLNESPFGLINRESQLITTFISSPTQLFWSPDSRQVVATVSAELLDSWAATAKIKEDQKLATLSPILQTILASSAADLVWSPKENKLLYTATASAVIPDNLIHQLPGSSTQTQERTLKPKQKYVYDLEEDRNFAVGNLPWTWFPTSNHLMRIEKQKIYIMEYDGQNSTLVYDGPMQDNFSIPYPSAKQLLILTNLNPTQSAAKISPIYNLYALSLR